jgi:hypothetical protein
MPTRRTVVADHLVYIAVFVDNIMSGYSRVAIQKPLNSALGRGRCAAVQHNHVDVHPVARGGVWAFDKALDGWFHLSRALNLRILHAFNLRIAQAALHTRLDAQVFFLWLPLQSIYTSSLLLAARLLSKGFTQVTHNFIVIYPHRMTE